MQILDRLITGLIWLYGAACVLAIGFAIVGVYGLFGQELAPLSAIFAIVLAAPLVALIDFGPSEAPEFVYLGFIVVSMAVNIVVLMLVRRLVRRYG